MSQTSANSYAALSTKAPDQGCAGSVLTIDLQALAENYTFLANQSQKAACAAVIKADAYGLGLEPAAKTLWAAGCRIFFIAHPQEGANCRFVLPEEAEIYVLNGLFADRESDEHFYVKHNLRPVIGSWEELNEWQAIATQHRDTPSYALHFDTGMNRLGFEPRDASALAEHLSTNPNLLQPSLIMSHLACADAPHHALNSLQLDRFRAIREQFPGIPASLANSGGIFLGPDYHFDLMRPGIALYGAQAVENVANPMQPVVTLQSRILNTRFVPKGQSISYGAAHIAQRDSHIATISCGYADGFLRAGGSTDAKTGSHVWLGGYEVPIIGRVTMDLIMIDITDIPQDTAATIAKRGQWVELFGHNIAIDDIATNAGTIGYEILTSLGRRAQRIYQEAQL